MRATPEVRKERARKALLDELERVGEDQMLAQKRL